MSDQELKNLLSKLQQELLNTETVSAETLSLVRELEADVHRLVPPDPKPELFESVLEQAKTLERQFAANHPVAERFMGQIMDLLARMGI